MWDMEPSARLNFNATVAMIVLATLSVLSNFAVKLSRSTMPHVSDYLILVALLLLYTYAGIVFNFIFKTSVYGSFDMQPTRGVPELGNILLVDYKLEILLGCIITVVRLSILSLTHSISGITKSTIHKRLIQGVAAACLIWLTIVTILVIFQCRPINAYWDLLLRPKAECFSSAILILGYEISNLILNVVVFLVSMSIVWELMVKMTEKVGAVTIFILGSFVCISSIVKIIYIYRPPSQDMNVNYPSIMEWSILQLGLIITSACLPSLAPIISVLIKLFAKLALHSKTFNFKPKMGYKLSDQHSTASDTEMSNIQATSYSWAQGGMGALSHGGKHANIPPGTIVVDRDVEIS